jgi:acyl carrier protein phosphodiesterase
VNFLAHLYLSPETPEGRLGSFLGDHVKGPLERADYPPAVLAAVRLHRAVDMFTDTHPAVRESKARISPARRRYAGILVDIFYDHFLAADWSRHHPMPLGEYVRSVYRDVGSPAFALPPRLAAMLPRLIEHDWLTAYRHTDGIAQTLEAMARRIPHAAALAGGIDELVRHHDALREDFERFFPEVVSQVAAPATARSGAPLSHTR